MTQIRQSIYSVHPSIAMAQSTIKNLKERTGRSLDEWIELVKSEGPPTSLEASKWLKSTHGLGTNYASWIAEQAETRRLEDYDPEAYLRAADGYVEAMYAGPKSILRPLYDELLKLSISLGTDVKACPCKTIVPIYRNHVIAQIKPATRARIDFGLALKDAPPRGKLIETGGFAKKDRITHRLSVTTKADINVELKEWLRKAYDLDASA